MKLRQILKRFLVLILITTLFYSCQQEEKAKKKVIYINSYHLGHPSSDEITAGILESFPVDSFDLDTFFMDTKRNTSHAFIEKRAAQLFEAVQQAEPNILIVSDDNAVKYLVKPHLQDLDMPIVFCGVNWSDREYALPADKVTGMLEILPLADLLETMRTYYPSMQKLLVLTENTTTSRKEEQLLGPLFRDAGVEATNQLVDDFDSWKTAFKAANESYDMIYIPTHGGIKGWDHEEAVAYVDQQMKVPLITCEDFMMPYVVFGMTKVAKEQGFWAAETAKKILDGKAPADFPVTRNRESTVWLNARLAEKIGFQPDRALLNRVKLVEKIY